MPRACRRLSPGRRVGVRKGGYFGVICSRAFRDVLLESGKHRSEGQAIAIAPVGSNVVLSQDARTVAHDKRAELAALRKAFCEAIAAVNRTRPPGDEQPLLTSCHGLRGDLMAMPTATVRAINDVFAPEPKLQYGASFAEGAAIVVALVSRWRASQ